MGIDNPVGGRPKDPYERYQWTIQDQQGGGSQRGNEPPEKKPYLAALILDLVKKTVDFIVQLTHGTVSGSTGEQIRENLGLLKAAFEELKKEDLSQDPSFLGRLSDLWHETLEISLRFKRQDKLTEPLHLFLKEIQNYPPGGEHSFAYYLTEYSGKDWLPFPYMDLIYRIHWEYLENPSSSSLERWTQELHKLLGILKGE